MLSVIKIRLFEIQSLFILQSALPETAGIGIMRFFGPAFLQQAFPLANTYIYIQTHIRMWKYKIFALCYI